MTPYPIQTTLFFFTNKTFSLHRQDLNTIDQLQIYINLSINNNSSLIIKKPPLNTYSFP